MKGDGGDNRPIDPSAPISFISPYPHISFPYTVPCSDLLVAAMSRCVFLSFLQSCGFLHADSRLLDSRVGENDLHFR